MFRKFRSGGIVVPADRRERLEYAVDPREAETLDDGELVVATGNGTVRFGPPQVHVVERLGSADAPGAFSLLSIAAFELPVAFPPEALAEADAAPPLTLAGREDLRDLALVTIDGRDARDFDDAVWAEPDPDAANPGGWHIVVAIADVAWYVRAGRALDREAARRGNSVYFPDRVVPMLPEALSNRLCSLVPGEDRACVAAELWIDGDGRKRRHRFVRGLMRSAARLTYEAVQATRDRNGSIALAPERLAALYGAWAALDRARQVRGALALDLPEDRVMLDPTGHPVAVVRQPRLDSHRLIEEFMILANVSAAEELEARHRPCVYRVHDLPDPDKVEALREFLDEMGVPGLKLVKGERLRPELFNRILGRATGSAEAPLVNELVLRAQAQAAYSPRNIGHFGLALPRYAHFTSPIRRYADLLVHRALLGEMTLAPDELAAATEHISATERRAVAAERAALDRYRTALLAGAVDTVFEARITGVARFGLFVSVADGGGDGLLPVATLPGDYYHHDARRHRLIGSRTRRAFALGDPVTVRLVEADPTGGRLLFRFEDSTPDTPPRRSPRAIAHRSRTRRR